VHLKLQPIFMPCKLKIYFVDFILRFDTFNIFARNRKSSTTAAAVIHKDFFIAIMRVSQSIIQSNFVIFYQARTIWHLQ